MKSLIQKISRLKREEVIIRLIWDYVFNLPQGRDPPTNTCCPAFQDIPLETLQSSSMFVTAASPAYLYAMRSLKSKMLTKRNQVSVCYIYVTRAMIMALSKFINSRG